jgi:cyclophilin family peptidyl-prolyl cis-trans isomerase
MKKLLFLVLLSAFALSVHGKNITVVMETNMGDIEIELYPDDAPITVDNFLQYAKDDFYDELIFHRVVVSPIPFMIQGGGFDTELNKPEVRAPIINEFGLSNVRGTIAMAKVGGDPNSATSQFFINLDDNSSNLDNQNGGFTVFGSVIKGMEDVVDTIANVPTWTEGGMDDVPFRDVVIHDVKILGDLDEDFKVETADLALSAQQWLQNGYSEEAKLSESPDGSQFGYSVAIEQDYAIVGASFENDNGAAYIFKRSDDQNETNWILQDRLTASDGAADDWFGYSVDIYQKYAIVGAPTDDDKGTTSGSAYIFRQNDDPNDPYWIQKTKITASDGESLDWFGHSVSIYDELAVAGAFGVDDNGAESGALYIFKPKSTIDPNWIQVDKLGDPDNTPGDDRFGYSVAMWRDYIIAGAYRDDSGTISNSGAAYVSRLSSSGWSQPAKLIPSDPNEEIWFGYSVDIYGDYAIVGAVGDDDKGNKSGSAYIFRFDAETSSWEEQNKLIASDGAAFDRFGCSVSIDKDYAIVGSRFDDDNGNKSGSAYLFYRDDTDLNWKEHQKIVPPDGQAEDRFGFSASISRDYAIVGATEDDDNGSDSGSAYVYRICPAADLNGDCTVDLADLSVFAGNWLAEQP